MAFGRNAAGTTFSVPVLLSDSERNVAEAVPISIGRGENRGQQVTYYNVVRNLVKVGDWNGGAGSWTIPVENISRDGVDAAVVYVQDGSRGKPGAMLGAAYTALR